MNHFQPCFSWSLTKWFERLSCYQPVYEVELYIQVIKSNVDFPIWVGEISKQSEVPIEVFGRSEVDGIEACVGNIKQRVFWLDNQEDDQSCEAKEDYEEAEHQAYDRTAPDYWVCPPRLME